MSQAKPTLPDKIFEAIELHRNASRLWAAAVAVRSASFLDSENPAEMEQQATLDHAVAERRLQLIDAGLELIGTMPTTPEGILVALEYARDQLIDGGVAMPQAMDWLGVMVSSLADAAGDIVAKYPPDDTP